MPNTERKENENSPAPDDTPGEWEPGDAPEPDGPPIPAPRTPPDDAPLRGPAPAGITAAAWVYLLGLCDSMPPMTADEIADIGVIFRQIDAERAERGE
ncbi:MAG TPA: hypothetical protein VGL64_02605 [Amycolatopsis sp.]|jgi:hypothetical protein